jgi:prepilin-type N-terminal cleavage/methylation domain-containing protein
MKKHHLLRNQEGFTLVEIIAVLIILGILAAVAVPRYIDLESNAKRRGAEAAVSELNGRESLIWAEIKISQTGYAVTGGNNSADDPDVWLTLLDGKAYPDLGDDYKWNSEGGVIPTINSGGKFAFKGQVFTVSRKISTRGTPAVWTLKP